LPTVHTYSLELTVLRKYPLRFNVLRAPYGKTHGEGIRLAPNEERATRQHSAL